jgi:hypothetical protein
MRERERERERGGVGEDIRVKGRTKGGKESLEMGG